MSVSSFEWQKRSLYCGHWNRFQLQRGHWTPAGTGRPVG